MENRFRCAVKFNGLFKIYFFTFIGFVDRYFLGLMLK